MNGAPMSQPVVRTRPAGFSWKTYPSQVRDVQLEGFPDGVLDGHTFELRIRGVAEPYDGIVGDTTLTFPAVAAPATAGPRRVQIVKTDSTPDFVFVHAVMDVGDAAGEESGPVSIEVNWSDTLTFELDVTMPAAGLSQAELDDAVAELEDALDAKETPAGAQAKATAAQVAAAADATTKVGVETARAVAVEATKADDSAVVKLAGMQTVAGAKTFTGATPVTQDVATHALLVTLPDGTVNAIAVKVAATSAGYGKGQAFVVLEAGAGDATDSTAAGSILMRIADDGGIGTSSGVHVASGLRATYTGNSCIWLTPVANVPGILSQPGAGVTAKHAQFCAPGTTSDRATIDANGHISVCLNDGTPVAVLYATTATPYGARAIFQTGHNDVVGLVLTGNGDSQAADLLQIMKAAGSTKYIVVDDRGNFLVNNNASVPIAAIYAGTTPEFGVRAVFGTGADAAIGLYVHGTGAGQTGDLVQIVQSSGGAILSRFGKVGHFFTRKTAAPADADVATSELGLYFDDTPGAVKLRYKAKDSAGTVVTADLAPAANPVFTGTVTVPDGALAIADTNGLQAALDAKQPATAAWTDATYSGTWVSFDAAHKVQYRLVGETVEVRGWAKSGTPATSIFTLPAGLRPPRSLVFAVDNNNAVGLLTVETTGTVTPFAGGASITTLDMIRFSIT